MNKSDTTAQELRAQMLLAIERHTVYSQNDPQDLEVLLKIVYEMADLFDTYASQKAVAAGKKQLYFADSVISSYHTTREQLTQIQNRIHDLDSQLTQESEAQS